MTIRQATNADTAAVKGLVFSILRSCGLEPDPTTTDADLDDLEKHYFQARGWFAVLETKECVVGTYGLFSADDFTCELRKMYLSPECRGSGYGKLLLEDGVVIGTFYTAGF